MARYFHWTREKWETIPWHDQRLYVDGLVRSGLWEPDGPASEQDVLERMRANGIPVERR